MLWALLAFTLPTSLAELGKVKKINSADIREIQQLVRGGEPWVVMCTDMKDNEIGTTLATNSVKVFADDDVHVGIMKCRQKLEGSEKSFVEKFGLEQRKGTPLIFVAANGDRPKQLEMPAYAKLVTEAADKSKGKKKGKSGKKGKNEKKPKKKKAKTKPKQFYQPEASILIKSVLSMVRVPKIESVSKQTDFHKACLYKKYCVVAAVNGKLPTSHPTAIALRRLSKKYRTVRFTVVDQTRLKFSHDKLLPDNAKGSEANEPRLLVLQKLSKKEGRQYTIIDLPPAENQKDPKTKDMGLLANDVAMSLCADKIDEDMGAAAVHAVFEKHRVNAPNFLGKSEGKTSKAAVRMAKMLNSPNLLIRVRDKYLTWNAAAPYLVAQLLFGSSLAPQAVDNLERVFPVKKRGGVPKFAALALERSKIPDNKSDNYAQLDAFLQSTMGGKTEMVPIETTPRIGKRKDVRDKENAEAKKMRQMRRARKRRRQKDKQAAKQKHRVSAKRRKQAEKERKARERIEEETKDTMPQMADEEDKEDKDASNRWEFADESDENDKDTDDDDDDDDDDEELDLDDDDAEEEELELDDLEIDLDDADEDVDIDDDDLFLVEDDD